MTPTPPPGPSAPAEAEPASARAAALPAIHADHWSRQPPCHVPAAYAAGWSWKRLRRVEDLPTPAVIMTIDGGLDIAAFQEALDLLKRENVQATFFLMTGPLSASAEGAELLRRLVRDGHEIANHTSGHPHLTKRSDAQIRQQLLRADRWIESVLGHGSGPFFREPYLDRDPRVDRQVRGLCFRSVWFTSYTRDDIDGISADEIVRAALGFGPHKGSKRERRRKRGVIANGSIFMFHASQRENLEAWPRIFKAWRKRGFEILPLGKALGLQSARAEVR